MASSRAAERATPTEAMTDEYVSTIFEMDSKRTEKSGRWLVPLTLSDGTTEIKAIVA